MIICALSVCKIYMNKSEELVLKYLCDIEQHLS